MQTSAGHELQIPGELTEVWRPAWTAPAARRLGYPGASAAARIPELMPMPRVCRYVARWAAPLFIASVIVGCGDAVSLTRSRAVSEARSRAVSFAVERERTCHEVRPRVTRVNCHAVAQAWLCDYALSDGSSGSTTVARGSTKEISTVSC
jgi:hypothetical protein